MQQQQTEFEALQGAKGIKADMNGLPPTKMASSGFAPVSLDNILRGMNSWRAKEQQEAVRAARLLVTSAPDQLLTLARMEAQNYQRHVVQGAVISLSAVGLVGLWTFVLYQAGGWWQPEMQTAFCMIAIISFVMACWVGAYLPHRARHSMIDVYQHLDDPRFIGLALNLLVPNGISESRQSLRYIGYVQVSVTGALLKMLKRVNVSHKTLLTREQMQTLLSLMLHPKTDTALTLAILSALQQIGDESAIPAVERVSRAKRGVHSEALTCLEYLRGQADQIRQAQTLLRASDSATATKTEHLLRPANPEADTAPEQLLRPA